ncbi:hypothetical protein BGZ68_001772, partial [Mortierella alpina]
PFLLFIRADDLGSFVEQVDVAKSTAAITHMRFWFQSPNWPQEIPCEATLLSTVDGLVVVMRRCRPFVRRRLIGYADMCAGTPMSQPSSVESDSSQYMRSKFSTPSSVSKSSCWKDQREVFSASISRIIELDDDEERKPIIPAPEVDRGMLDETASQVEDQRYFRPHVQVDCDEDIVEDDESDMYRPI